MTTCLTFALSESICHPFLSFLCPTFVSGWASKTRSVGGNLSVDSCATTAAHEDLLSSIAPSNSGSIRSGLVGKKCSLLKQTPPQKTHSTQLYLHLSHFKDIIPSLFDFHPLYFFPPQRGSYPVTPPPAHRFRSGSLHVVPGGVLVGVLERN